MNISGINDFFYHHILEPHPVVGLVHFRLLLLLLDSEWLNTGKISELLRATIASRLREETFLQDIERLLRYVVGSVYLDTFSANKLAFKFYRIRTKPVKTLV